MYAQKGTIYDCHFWEFSGKGMVDFLFASVVAESVAVVTHSMVPSSSRTGLIVRPLADTIWVSAMSALASSPEPEAESVLLVRLPLSVAIPRTAPVWWVGGSGKSSIFNWSARSNTNARRWKPSWIVSGRYVPPQSSQLNFHQIGTVAWTQ